MATINQSAQIVKNFTGLKTIEEITTQLDLVFARLGNAVESKSQTHSLLDAKAAVPTMRAGDFVIDYRDGKVLPGMSDGRSVQPFTLDTLSGALTTEQHGFLDSVVLDEDGNIVGRLHTNATTDVPGFMSATDKARFDNLTPGTTPPAVDASAGAAGSNAAYSRSDHTHQAAVGVPVAIGTANAPGVSNNLVRADHVHNHGALGGGNLHAAATTGTAGFISAADKTELDRLNAMNLIISFDGTNYYLNVTTAGGTKRVGPLFT